MFVAYFMLVLTTIHIVNILPVSIVSTEKTAATVCSDDIACLNMRKCTRVVGRARDEGINKALWKVKQEQRYVLC
jgi:hypothetical protein